MEKWTYAEEAEPLLQLYSKQLSALCKECKRAVKLNPDTEYVRMEGLEAIQKFSGDNPTGWFFVDLEGDDGKEFEVGFQL